MLTKIMGIGCVTALGNSIETVWENLILNDFSQTMYNCPYIFEDKIKNTVVRRSTRYARLALYTLSSINEYAMIDKGLNDGLNVGTIYSTDFGSLDTNLKFANQVFDAEPNLCSPTLFSNTVQNSVLATLCIPNNLRGVSTMLCESNNIVYSTQLLSEEKAEYIYTGFIAEYNKDLFDTYIRCNLTRKVSECVISFLLTNKEAVNLKEYCKIGAFCDMNINDLYIPNYTSDLDIKNVYTKCIHKTIAEAEIEKVDGVILAFEGTELESIELEILENILKNTIIIKGRKDIFGETFGADFNLSVMIGALCLNHNQIPKCLGGNVEKVTLNNILVLGMSRLGNIYSMILTH